MKKRMGVVALFLMQTMLLGSMQFQIPVYAGEDIGDIPGGYHSRGSGFRADFPHDLDDSFTWEKSFTGDIQVEESDVHNLTGPAINLCENANNTQAYAARLEVGGNVRKECASECYGVFEQVKVGSQDMDIRGDITTIGYDQDFNSFNNGIYQELFEDASATASANVTVGGSVTAMYGLHSWCAGILIRNRSSQGSANVTVEKNVLRDSSIAEYHRDLSGLSDIMAVGVRIQNNGGTSTVKAGSIEAVSAANATGVDIDNNTGTVLVESGDITATTIDSPWKTFQHDNSPAVNLVTNTEGSGQVQVRARNLISSYSGIDAQLARGTTAKVYVENEIKAEGPAIRLVALEDIPEAEQGILDVTAWKITSGTGELTQVISKSGVKLNLRYLIKFDGLAKDQITMTGDGVSVDSETGLYTAAPGETVTITVKDAAQYAKTVLFNNGTELSRNANGTFALTIPENGGVLLSGKLEKAPETETVLEPGDGVQKVSGDTQKLEEQAVSQIPGIKAGDAVELKVEKSGTAREEKAITAAASKFKVNLFESFELNLNVYINQASTAKGSLSGKLATPLKLTLPVPEKIRGQKVWLLHQLEDRTEYFGPFTGDAADFELLHFSSFAWAVGDLDKQAADDGKSEEGGTDTVFTDVAANKRYYAPVNWAPEKGITTGVDKTHFAPDKACTRAQAMTFLWRAAGSPETAATSKFTDVPSGRFYSRAVDWAVQNGITSGTSETTFGPNDTCTRAQTVTFLEHRYNR